jgi:AcrR family transcriptional regulator
VPKIKAVTLAAHREMQRTALLDAARALLAEGGTDALTFPALAARTGLARSSVYEYFGSRGAVVEALFAADFPVWTAQIEDAMSEAPTPQGRVEAYVRAQLELAGDPRHRALAAVSSAELGADTRDRIRASHGALADLVVSALRELGHERPETTAVLLQGLVETVVRRLDPGAGEDRRAVADTAVSFALRGVGADPVRAAAVDGGAAACTGDAGDAGGGGDAAGTGSSRIRPNPSSASGSR